MLKAALILIVVAIAAVLVYAATRPDILAVQRSTVIDATPDKLYPLINDIRAMNSWSPYLAKDPQVKGTYSGPPSGPGAAFAFEGNKDVGQGSVTITGIQAPRRVDMRLDMVKPFAGSNDIQFSLQPQAGSPQATQVTWAMRGKSPYIAKLAGVFMNMDHMIGRDFEAGLANLKAMAEKR